MVGAQGLGLPGCRWSCERDRERRSLWLFPSPCPLISHLCLQLTQPSMKQPTRHGSVGSTAYLAGSAPAIRCTPFHSYCLQVLLSAFCGGSIRPWGHYRLPATAHTLTLHTFFSPCTAYESINSPLVKLFSEILQGTVCFLTYKCQVGNVNSHIQQKKNKNKTKQKPRNSLNCVHKQKLCFLWESSSIARKTTFQTID